METIRGRKSHELDLNELKQQLANYDRIALDLGTGDGRYVRTLAEKRHDWFVIGVDSCRENLREHSQAKLPNALFVIANAQHLPQELYGLVSHISINFPWGSLLECLLTGDHYLMSGLRAITRCAASVDLHLNGGALAEAGTILETGTQKIYSNLLQSGWQVKPPTMINTTALRSFPSTWAKRLAFGRDPRAMMLRGYLK